MNMMNTPMSHPEMVAALQQAQQLGGDAPQATPQSGAAPTADASRQAALDRAAQQKGFRSYEEYRLYMNQRANKTGGTVEGAGQPAQPQAAPAQNPLNGGLSGLFDYIRRAMGGQ